MAVSRITKANRAELEAARDELKGMPKYLPRELLEQQLKETWETCVTTQIAYSETMDRVKTRIDPATRSLKEGDKVMDTIYYRPGVVVSFQGFMAMSAKESKSPYITEMYKVKLTSFKATEGTFDEILVLPLQLLKRA